MGGLDSLFIVAVLILSVILHELAHGYSALFLGDQTAKYAGRLTLNPIKHLDPFGSILVPLMLSLLHTGIIFGWAKPVPYNPYNLRNQRWGEAIVAAAGPFTNAMLALVFGFILRIGISWGVLSEAFITLGSAIVIINIVLAIFNLIPIPPLDGSKVFFSLLPLRFAHFRARFEQFGFIFIIILIFFIWQFVFPVVTWLFSLITGLSI